MDISSVAVKLPTFWQTNTAAWFIQAEAQFALRGITADDTRYYHVVAALDTDTANRALSVLMSPPATDKYQALKSFLSTTYQLSEEERASALCSLPGLGDRKPSELMDSMLALLGDHQPCFLFMHLFFRQLPDYIRAPLANSPSKDKPRALAQEADRLYVCVNIPQTIQQIERHAHLQKSKVKTTHGRTICWYHRKFGKDAKKCIPPCEESTQGNCQQGQQ